ncbi:MAG: MMPL family transporter [Deltaproteobacteria bacterium]|nr:MMPL family transporter [Deltaproteobacteria bacterium]
MDLAACLEKIVRWILRHRWPVLGATLVLTVLGAWGSSEIPILTSRKALVPQDIPEAKRLQRFLDRFGAGSDLILAVEGAGRPALETFVRELALRLNDRPEVSLAMERVDIRFFLEHAFLLLPADGMRKLVPVLDRLLAEEREVPPEEPGDWDEALARIERWMDDPPEFTEFELDLKAAEESLALLDFFAGQWLHFIEAEQAPEEIAWNRLLAERGAEMLAGGYFASHNGKMLLLFVRAANPSEEIEQLGPFIETVRSVSDELVAEWAARGTQGISVAQTSLPASSYEEYHAMRRDIALIISTAALLIILLIGLWLRSLRWALIVFVPMGLGVLWNTGLALLTVEHLTILTSGFTAILFGLGVDYGIFMSTRILEERRQGAPLERAIAQGVAGSARALFTAGGATVLIFLTLATVEFSGFSELGLVAAGGVALVLASTFALQPLLFALIPPAESVAARSRSALSERRRLKLSPWLAVCLVLFGLLLSGAGVVAAYFIPFDYDVMAMLPSGSEAARYQQRLLAETDYQGEVVIFTAPDVDRARELAARAAKLSTVSKVQTITPLFPADAESRAEQARQIGERIDSSRFVHRFIDLAEIALEPDDAGRIRQALEKAREMLEDGQEQALSAGHAKIVTAIEPLLVKLESLDTRFESDPRRALARTERYTRIILKTLQEGLRVLASWKTARALSPDRLPESLRSRFFAADGTVAFFAHPAGNVYDPGFLDKLVREVYSVSKDATGFPTTHQEFSHMVVRSFHQGTLRCALVALVWIAFLLRRWRSVVIASLPLVVGGGWMMALMAGLGIEFNYANIIGLPLVMGLAMDYGVWFAHRRDDMPEQSPWTVARVAGRAILLAAGTTLAGLGAITLASYKGVASMGVAITLGLVSCVLAALLISPAIAQLLFRGRAGAEPGQKSEREAMP